MRMSWRCGLLAAGVALALPRAAAGREVPLVQEPPAAQCAADLEQLIRQVERNYAGYAAKVGRDRSGLAALSDSVRAESGMISDEARCTTLLQRWLRFFQDRHLAVWPLSPPPPPPQQPPPAPDAPTRPDPLARFPSLIVLDTNAVLLRIPSFNLGFKPVLDSLLAEHRPRLLSTPLLILDLRGNSGGGDAAFAELVPFLYTGPIRSVGADFYASEDNVAFFRRLLEQAPNLPQSTQDVITRLLERAAAAPGGFVSMGEDEVITLQTVHHDPRDVAIIIDGRVASTAEEFLLQARQSGKVRLFGSSGSAGVLDYSNVRPVDLPSGLRRAGIPTSRSRRLPSEPVDPHGIAPDVRVPVEGVDAVTFVRDYYRAKAAP